MHINNSHLRKIVRELIENAFGASESGDKLEVSSELSDTDIIIQIKDTGEGLFQNQIEALNEGKRISNSGLGLVIVNELLELYHGVISFFSIPCRGTTVRFAIPRVSEDE
jgi:signal transduction histidine kinase